MTERSEHLSAQGAVETLNAPAGGPRGRAAGDDCGRGSDHEREDRRLTGRQAWFRHTWFSHAPHQSVRYGSAFVWLLFILFPLANAIGRHEPLIRHVLVVLGALVFIAAYIALILAWRSDRGDRFTGLLFGVMLAVATALTLGDASGWAFLFTYCAACAALIPPPPFGFWAVVTCSALAGLTSALAGAPGASVLGRVATSAGIGLVMLLFRDLRVRNEELSAARAELARLAVAQERERFARDLHDLLGHSLSVIALKAELTRRLIPDRPSDAAKEVAEVEQVARTALSEVREAVSGYRQTTLEGELAGARMALSAAGIKANVPRPTISLDPETEAILAWTVREGATNVIRHSIAQHCTVRVTKSLTDAAVEVLDDGVGAVGGNRGGVDRADEGTGVRGAIESAVPDDRGGSRGPDGVSRSGDARAGDSRSGDSRSGDLRSGESRSGDSRSADSPPSDPRADRGHGLEGLAERSASLHGRVEAGTRPDGGGFRLCVIVPINAR